HAGPLEEVRDAVVEAADDMVLPGDRLPEVEGRSGDGDAERGRGARPMDGLLEFLGRVDQRLRRDAADIEAGAAEPAALDDHRIDAELAGADRTDIAAGAGADHEQRANDLVHRVPQPSTKIRAGVS